MRGPLWLATAALLCCAFIAPAASQTLSASASVQVTFSWKLPFMGPYKNPMSHIFNYPQAGWKPKTQDAGYSGLTVLLSKDWAGVISACRAVGRGEKRVLNFFIRAAFHDGLAVNVTACANGNFKSTNPGCKGADSSALLTVEEMSRPENAYDQFTEIAGRAATKIASYYDVSVSDTLAICGAVAIEELTGGRVKFFDGYQQFLVGRLDSLTPSPPDQLPKTTAGVPDFNTFFTQRGFTMEEGVALMGTHALLDSQGCMNAGLSTKSYCNPYTSTCPHLRMFNLTNHYYKDACSPTITIKYQRPPLDFPDTGVVEMNDPEFNSFRAEQVCKFTSPQWRSRTDDMLQCIRKQGTLGGKVCVDVPDAIETLDISWTSKNCQGGEFKDPTRSCPHANRWIYTPLDAHLGQACQGQAPNPTATSTVQARDAMRKFATNQAAWDTAIVPAYKKMVTQFARFSTLLGIGVLPPSPVYIRGRECAVYKMDQQCYTNSGQLLPLTCTNCADIASLGPVTSTVTGLLGALSPATCHPCCYCSSAFRGDQALNVTASPFPPSPPPMAQPPEGPPAATTVQPDVTGQFYPINPSGQPLADPPRSPYLEPTTSCPDPTAGPVTISSVEIVRGFPSSPFPLKVFQNAYVKPTPHPKTLSYCNTTQGVCIDAYTITAVATEKNLNAGCPLPTKLLAYNGQVPGPYIRQVKGRQSLVRITNNITATPGGQFYPYHPCDMAGRSGRPIAVHHHGAASLAPFDGWAEDNICFNETKDYLYPNNRPGTGWFHDHALLITSENAYYGLAAPYHVVEKDDPNDSGAPWGMNTMEEFSMILADKTLDAQCQLWLDTEGYHKNSHYGDINMVNGIPFPVMDIEPKWVRFRILNAAVARPWLLSLVNTVGQEVSSSVCKMVASDGGYRRFPASIPSEGLFMGVAERYELVCDLRAFQGQTLYLWNGYDDRRMKAVPYFCHSHLVAKINVRQTCTSASCGAQFQPPAPGQVLQTHMDRVLTMEEYNTALMKAKSGYCDREFKFGRRHGQWVINGETWETNRVAASDVGYNSAEIWCFKTGGGWFHPIHVHLVDFYVLARLKGPAMQEYETDVPKDVVQLHPNSYVAVLARWGPHRGEYMFHCHNLMHEDHDMMRSFNTGNETSKNNPGGTLSNLVFGPTNPYTGSAEFLYDNYKDPMYPSAAAKPTSAWSPLTASYLQTRLSERVYRLFYPTTDDPERATLCSAANGWRVEPSTCPPTITTTTTTTSG